VRIFPGQDPTHVYVGWVTTQYHLHTKEFNQSCVRKSTITIADEFNRVIDRFKMLLLFVKQAFRLCI
jgi:ryanodine receptor 2